MKHGNHTLEPRPRCERCGKVAHRTFEDARRMAVGTHRDRPGIRGLEPYYSKSCGFFHVGRSTSKKREKARNYGRQKHHDANDL